MEISTGTTWPRCDSVAALYARQNSMMFTPCWPSAGPTGGAGVAAPAWICSLTTAASFLDFGGTSSLFSDLGYLVERQLDGRLPAEDRHQHLELLRVRADLADRRRQRRERPVHHGDGLADLEVDDLDLRLLGLLHRRGGEDADHLVERERRWAGGGADEPGDAGGVADRPPGLVVEVHPDQDVAGEDLPLHLLPLAVLDLGDLLGRHLDLEDVVLHVE